MAIKEHTDKSSMLQKDTRYNQGGYTDEFEKRLGWWEQDITIGHDDVTDIYVLIDSKYDKRPDLLAYKYYKKSTLAWLILQYNNMVDPTEEFVAGKTIIIPSPSRVLFEILTK